MDVKTVIAAATRGRPLALILLLAACGGGGGDDGGDAADGSPWQRRTALSDPLAAQCVNPRRGTDPYNGNRPYPDEAGTLDDEQDWLRTYMDEVYLWYEEIPDSNPGAYTLSRYGTAMNAMSAYFDSLLTPQRTDSGRYKDEFSFTYPTVDWQALSQSGVSVGYGAQFAILAASPPRRIVVAYADAATPAASAGIARGAEILAIDGEPVVDGDPDVLNAGLLPDSEGESHRFTLRDRGSASSRSVTLQARRLSSDPVPQVDTLAAAGGTVGYLLFNDHIAIAEGALLRAMRTLEGSGVADLVIDLRYNGGGYLDIAAELAYMVAGADATEGRVFERLRFNDHNPMAEADSARTPFHDETLGFDPGVAEGTALPALNLDRVFVLAGPGTCSASEALVNGLRGVDVEVVLIGSTTCGKPYGFYAQDNCGLSYFATEFEGVNDKGEGGYADGMAPLCAVADDFEHALGDPAEALLATALSYRSEGGCPAAALKALPHSELRLLRSPLRENAYARAPR